jgi:hypothetical protein
MTDAKRSASSSNKGRWKLWITLSELVGVLALIIAGLNFWDSHRERVRDEKRVAAAEQSAAQLAAARSSFVLTARTEGDGARLVLQPMSSDQAIQGLNLVFPADVADQPIASIQPRIERDWVARGLGKAVEAARKAKAAGAVGEGVLPVGVEASYVEDGEVKTDRSIYRISYSWKTPLLGGPHFTLEGATLRSRAVKSDLQSAVNAQWAATGVGGAAQSAAQ